MTSQPMGSNNQGEDKRRRREALWRRIRDAIYKAVNEVFRPLPPDVIEKIEDVLGRAERDFKDEEEKGQCLDDDSEKR